MVDVERARALLNEFLTVVGVCEVERAEAHAVVMQSLKELHRRYHPIRIERECSEINAPVVAL